LAARQQGRARPVRAAHAQAPDGYCPPDRQDRRCAHEAGPGGGRRRPDQAPVRNRPHGRLRRRESAGWMQSGGLKGRRFCFGNSELSVARRPDAAIIPGSLRSGFRSECVVRTVSLNAQQGSAGQLQSASCNEEQEMTIGVIGRKRGMTRIFSQDGASIPVTVIEVEPNRVSQLKSVESDGYGALQVTAGKRRPTRVTKPLAGHFAKAGVEAGRKLVEFRLGDGEGADL